MSNSISAMPLAGANPVMASAKYLIHLAQRIPLSLIQLGARASLAYVFWNSGQSKLASWPVTQRLFAMEYRVPVLPPDIAALLATAAELSGAILLFLGIFARLGAVALLGVVAVIQLFVYPGHWGEHMMWATMLLLIIARGAGVVSIDHLIARAFTRYG